MPLREGGRQKVHIYFQFKFGINSLFKSKSKWVEVTGVASKRCWVQGIDICWFGVWDSGVRVEDNSTDRTFTLNQTIRFRFKSNNQFRFKSKPDKLKITRQFFCSLLKLWTLRQSRGKATIVSCSSWCLRPHPWRCFDPTQRSRTSQVAKSTHDSLQGPISRENF